MIEHDGMVRNNTLALRVHGLKELFTLTAHGLEELFSACTIVSDFWLWQKMVFGFTSVLREQ